MGWRRVPTRSLIHSISLLLVICGFVLNRDNIDSRALTAEHEQASRKGEPAVHHGRQSRLRDRLESICDKSLAVVDVVVDIRRCREEAP